MHADQLRMAVTKIIDALIRSDVRVQVDQFRVASTDQRNVAAARLGNAGATLVGRFDKLSADERRVLEVLHLDSLGTTDYWQALINPNADPKAVRAEAVKLQSRIVFATNHLPGMIGLLESSSDSVDDHPYARYALAAGEARLVVRLTDASVVAADPDRIARAIDGIDMLYSACASIVQKHSIDLRLDAIDGSSPLREIHFTGDQDCMASVITIMDSIPVALAGIASGQDLDINAVVKSLPVFQELDDIADHGAFSASDMKDIRDSVHQGALLSLESGAILLDPPGHAAAASEAVSELNGEDEHYERYLREREAMQHGKASAQNGESSDSQAGSGQVSPTANGELPSEKPAVNDLLKSLLKERNK